MFNKIPVHFFGSLRIPVHFFGSLRIPVHCFGSLRIPVNFLHWLVHDYCYSYTYPTYQINMWRQHIDREWRQQIAIRFLGRELSPLLCGLIENHHLVLKPNSHRQVIVQCARILYWYNNTCTASTPRSTRLQTVVKTRETEQAHRIRILDCEFHFLIKVVFVVPRGLSKQRCGGRSSGKNNTKRGQWWQGVHHRKD